MALLTGMAISLSSATAQSSLTTVFLGNSSVPPGGATYFDVNVANPSGIVVRGLELNLPTGSGTVNVYRCPTTRTGNQANAAAWTLLSTGTATAAGFNVPSTVSLPSFVLPGGSSGIAIQAVGMSQRTAAGTGSNQTWNNNELTLTAGEWSSTLFGGVLTSPRVPNLRLIYDSRMDTPFDGTGGLFNSTIYFDVNVLHPNGITVTGLGLRSQSISGTIGTATIYTCAGSRAGQQLNAGAWTQIATGPITSAGTTAFSYPTLPIFTLPFGAVGMAVSFQGLGHRYTLTNSTHQNADLQISGGELTSSSFPFVGTLSPGRRVNCRFQYFPGGSQQSSFGTGCTAQYASLYEQFGAPSGNPFDLSGSGFALFRTGAGYQLTPAISYTLLPPTAAAVNLQLSDDSQATTPQLAQPFPYPGGTAANLVVCSNGFVSVANGNGTDFQVNPTTFLNASTTGYWVWRDLNPGAPGSGPVTFEQVGNLAVVSWNAVNTFGSTTTNTFQLQFDCISGEVAFVFGAIAPFTSGGIGSSGSDKLLVGYSPGGPSQAPLPTDISANMGFGWTLYGDSPLALSTTTAPIFGSSIDFVTSGSHPATALGAVVVALNAYPAGISLDPIMPGCFQYTDSLLMLPPWIGGGGPVTTSLAVPPAIGGQFYAQSIVLAPLVINNAINAATSNGLSFRIGSY